MTCDRLLLCQGEQSVQDLRISGAGGNICPDHVADDELWNSQPSKTEDKLLGKPTANGILPCGLVTLQYMCCSLETPC